MSVPADLFLPSDPLGPTGRIIRLRRNLPWMLNRFAGGIVEIGAGYGESTRVFLEAAERFGREVLVVDPWDFHDGVKQHDRSDSTYGYTYERFMQNVGSNPRLSVCRHPSSSPIAVDRILYSNLVSVVMADGDMGRLGTMHDMALARDSVAGVIIVDDYNVRRGAVDDFVSGSTTYKVHHDGRAHEAYLIWA